MFKGSKEKAVVRYSYAADNDDELTLKEGDIITLLDKNLEDAGWWKGELNGLVGVFPDNFVEVIPEESKVEAFSKTHNKLPPQPKPKKPPPPANSKHMAKPPELPTEKPKLPPPAECVQKSTKTDRHLPPEPNHVDNKPALPKKKEETVPEKRAPPSVKKPGIPPPVGTKPTAKSDTKLSSSVSDHKPIDIPKNFKKDSEDSLDVIESTDRLTHITASRAKGPSKRPPTSTQMNHSTEELFQDDFKGNMTGSIQVPKETNEVSHKASVPPGRPPEPSPVPTHLLALVEELKREITDIKAHTVSKKAYDELKHETHRLREELDSLKAKQAKQYRSLFDELDEEKKIRLNTQIDVDRIRKLVSESHV